MQVQASAGHDPNNTNGNSGNATPRTYRICEMTRPHLGIGDWYLRTAAMSDQAEMTREEQKTEFLDLTTEVVSAYVSHNSISPTDLPRLIADVHSAITDLKEAEVPEQTADQPKPMVPIKKSVTPDYLICLEDGKKFKSLKRHLRAHYNMSPDEYRTKWGLPWDYPMVAPAYAEKRSQLAKEAGLGRKR
tara:strand:+ start:2144 stop:2710 length:567 start_codon:yes stop_codon:yes gene_type:complete